MQKIKSLLLAATITFSFITTSHANTIIDVLSGSDNGFGYSGIHNATGCSSMSGSNFSKLSLNTAAGASFFHKDDLTSGENFKLFLSLDDKPGNNLLTLSGRLDFTVADGELIGNINADFADETIHADTFFKFVQGTMPIAGVNVPSPNGMNGDLISLWGANSTVDHLPNSIGFNSDTADLGIDLVIRWDESGGPNEVSEPGSVALLALGLFRLGMARMKKISV